MIRFVNIDGSGYYLRPQKESDPRWVADAVERLVLSEAGPERCSPRRMADSMNREESSPPAMAEEGDTDATAPCGRCEEPIPVDATRCPICGYQPAGSRPQLLRAAEVVFGAVIVVSVLIFVGGVAGIAPGLPADVLSRAAIITPYTTGISGFFLYYLHRKRRATPTDSDIFD
ncbi:hypothetical protein [Halobellus ordinarius]|uniref:hypothetical protein n=1 Tax=Halobellus ordinarius TaxID=3075120 RepID=UPI0028803508|nr:hypothetical protein [Halobellus sp. ZY16]